MKASAERHRGGGAPDRPKGDPGEAEGGTAPPKRGIRGTHLARDEEELEASRHLEAVARRNEGAGHACCVLNCVCAEEQLRRRLRARPVRGGVRGVRQCARPDRVPVTRREPHVLIPTSRLQQIAGDSPKVWAGAEHTIVRVLERNLGLVSPEGRAVDPNQAHEIPVWLGVALRHTCHAAERSLARVGRVRLTALDVDGGERVVG